jgi:curved DNA-binding protein CbpA
MTDRPDPYRELGVPSTASPATVRLAYLAKARSHHPDLGGNVRRMARINDAWELLRDPAKRSAYDALVATREPAGEPWRGAAGRPPGQPSGSILDFGIFAGWSLGEIARRDPGYLVWLSERREGRPLQPEIARYVDALRPSPPDRRRAGKRR